MIFWLKKEVNVILTGLFYTEIGKVGGFYYVGVFLYEFFR